MKSFITSVVLAVSLTGCVIDARDRTAQEPNPQRQLVNPPGSEVFYEQWRFSQAVQVGNTLWISGQVGMDGNQIGEGLEEQTRIAFEHLRGIVESRGGSLKDIVMLNSYHTDISQIETFNRVKDRYLPSDYPAWTAVGVTGLAHPDLVIEVEAVAVIGSN